MLDAMLLNKAISYGVDSCHDNVLRDCLFREIVHLISVGQVQPGAPLVLRREVNIVVDQSFVKD